MLSTPEGDVPATGRSIRLPECDVISVRDSRAVSHRFYYDRLDLASQLGLDESGGAVPAPRAGKDQASRTPAR
jgi:hypothetical protein